MEKLEIKTFTYRYNKDFLIDVTVSKGGVYEGWIYLDGYGFKLYMFGIENTNIDDFKELVYANVWSYMQEYIDIKNIYTVFIHSLNS